jgi:DnaJ-class molecular chaperone
MADDYYQILGVGRDASADEIQKAYRKLARKYHPDLQEDDQEKAKAKQRFQKVQVAYDVLSDAEKRKKYDRFGPNFEQMGGAEGGPFPGGQHREVDIDWSQLFGGGRGGGGAFQDFFSQFQGRGAAGRGPRGPAAEPAIDLNLQEEITVPFAMAVNGGEYQLLMSRDGRQESIVVKIPIGIEDGKRVRLKGQGRMAPNGERGDLLVRVKVAPHPQFQRQGPNLRLRVPVTVFEAWLGAKIDVPTPHGTVTITVPPGSSGGQVLRLKGLGIRLSKPAATGDLLAELEIVVPPVSGDEQRRAIENLRGAFPATNPRGELKW